MERQRFQQLLALAKRHLAEARRSSRTTIVAGKIACLDNGSIARKLSYSDAALLVEGKQ
jgi:hypothetical protein